MVFKDRLKSLRIDNDLTQEDVAKKLHITRQALSNYEHQVSEPNIETLILLAKFFNVSVDYLLGLTDNPTPYRKK